MKGVFVITLGEAIALCVVAAVILVAICVGISNALHQWLCPHTELTPPRTALGAPGGGYGWQCKKCRKDFGWGTRPSAGG